MSRDILVLERLCKSFGPVEVTRDVSLAIRDGERHALIGPNGAGKSTLFKMIEGAEKPDKGEVNVGHTVKIAYVDQSRDALEADKNVWQAVSGGSDIITAGSCTTQICSPTARVAGSEVVFSSWSCHWVRSVITIS